LNKQGYSGTSKLLDMIENGKTNNKIVFASSVSQTHLVQMYNVYLSGTIGFGHTVPSSYNEFQNDFLKSYEYEPMFAMINADDVVCLGWINNNAVNSFRTDISYIVNPDYRNKGYAVEIANYMIDYAKKNYGTKTIEAATYSNPISEKVLTKIGFINVGTIPETKMINGKLKDITFWYKKV